MPTPAYKRDMKKQRRLQDCFEQENKIANYLDKNKTFVGNEQENPKTNNSTGFDDKKPNPSHRTKPTKKTKTINNSKQESQLKPSTINEKPSNPHCKEINRHFGTFKTRILGNHLKAFNSLPFRSLTPLGIKGSGCKRKLLKQAAFSATFHQNGTVLIKPSRKRSSSKMAVEELQADYFEKAGKAIRFLESAYLLSLAEIKVNQLPKYGVEDLTARKVNREIKGEFRQMDSSIRIVNGKTVRRTPHVDNFGAAACRRDNQFSEEKQFELAEARITNPEYFYRLEKTINRTVEAGVVLGNHMKAHVGVMKEIRAGLHELSSSVRGVSARRVRMPTAFKTSATVRGVV